MKTDSLPGEIPECLSMKGACRLLGLHISRLRSAVRWGEGPATWTEAGLRHWWDAPEHLCRMAFESKRPTGSVYFIQAENGVGLVKVGWSIDVDKRLGSLQRCSPVKLEVLGSVSGSKHLEYAIHSHFAGYRQHGEWFTAIPALFALIDSITAEQSRRRVAVDAA